MASSLLKLLTVLCTACAAMDAGSCGRDGCDEAALVQKVLTVGPKKLSTEEAKAQLKELVQNLADTAPKLLSETEALVKGVEAESQNLNKNMVKVKGTPQEAEALQFTDLLMEQKEASEPSL